MTVGKSSRRDYVRLNSRGFLQRFGGCAVAGLFGGCVAGGFNVGCMRYQGERLKFGIIGAGGKGWTDWRNMFWHGELPVAICDVDRREIDKSLAEIRSKGFRTDSILRAQGLGILNHKERSNV